jgi:hypothetical protein
MMERKGDYQKRAVDDDRLLRIQREHTTHAQMAARQSQQSASLVTRARISAAARHPGERGDSIMAILNANIMRAVMSVFKESERKILPGSFPPG